MSWAAASGEEPNNSRISCLLCHVFRYYDSEPRLHRTALNILEPFALTSCGRITRRHCLVVACAANGIFLEYQMKNDNRSSRDIHAIDDEGMVLCNPRDKEASHRAAKGDIATGEGGEVTCRKCLSRLRRLHQNKPKDQPATSRMLPAESTQAPAQFVRIRGLASMAAQYRPGDGIDPKEEKRDKLRGQKNRKTDHSCELLASQILDASIWCRGQA